MVYRSMGLSLVELLIALSLVALLLFRVLDPDLAGIQERRRIEGAMDELVMAIGMARQGAVTENRLVTLCPGVNGRACRGKWHQDLIIFTDANGDREINGSDRMLFRLPAIEAEGELSFNSFRNRQYLQMTPLGFTNYQNGNFTFCPANGDPRLARQIIISLSGRTRYARDEDGDGIVENSRGEALRCD